MVQGSGHKDHQLKQSQWSVVDQSLDIYFVESMFLGQISINDLGAPIDDKLFSLPSRYVLSDCMEYEP